MQLLYTVPHFLVKIVLTHGKGQQKECQNLQMYEMMMCSHTHVHTHVHLHNNAINLLKFKVFDLHIKSVQWKPELINHFYQD